VRIPILTYHAVLPLAPGEQVRGAVPLETFRAQVAFLARRGFTALDPGRAAVLLQGRGAPVRRPVVLTFDDGYRCVLEHALPVLEAAGLCATLYVVTERVGGRSDWYVRKGGRPFEHADWAELEGARARGFTVGSHGVSHRALPGLAPAELARELDESREVLARRLGACEHFAYPFGRVSPAVVEAVARAGYRTAVSTEPGRNRPGQPPLRLRRQNVGRRTGAFGFRRRLGLLW
jgi:peptidoglycan/xylan/chitin deacetylase (PgdA/CDA1 family)